MILKELLNAGLTLKSCSFSTFVSLFFSSEQQDILWTLFPYDHIKTQPVSLFQCLGAIDKTTTHTSYKPLNGFTSITSALSNLYHLNGGFSLVNSQVKHISRDKQLINISTNHGDVFSTKSYLQFLLHVSLISLSPFFFNTRRINEFTFDRVLFFSEDLFYIQS